MSSVSIPTSFNISLEFEVPGFGRRLVALAIDMVVQFIYALLAFSLLDSLRGTSFGVNSGFDDWALRLIIMVPIFLYHILMETLTNGQSVGKKIMQLRVVSMTGGRPAISQLMIRWLLRISDMWIFLLLFVVLYLMSGAGGYDMLVLVIFGLGFLLADIILVAASAKAQRIGDILAQTILIRIGREANLDGTIFQEVDADYQPRFPQVMRISDRDLNTIKRLLDGRGSTNEATRELAAAKIKQYLKIETDLPAAQFLDQLLRDYNFLSAR